MLKSNITTLIPKVPSRFRLPRSEFYYSQFASDDYCRLVEWDDVKNWWAKVYDPDKEFWALNYKP